MSDRKTSRSEMLTIFDETTAACRKLMVECQADYAHDEGNGHANFDRLAAELNTSPEKVLWIFLRKHLDAIVAWVNGESSEREGIDGRVHDAINYLALLKGMAARRSASEGKGLTVEQLDQEVCSANFCRKARGVHGQGVHGDDGEWYRYFTHSFFEEL